MMDRIAKNCAHWQPRNDVLGSCDVCGAQHQFCQVWAFFKCPHFRPRRIGQVIGTLADSDGDDGA